MMPIMVCPLRVTTLSARDGMGLARIHITRPANIANIVKEPKEGRVAGEDGRYFIRVDRSLLDG